PVDYDPFAQEDHENGYLRTFDRFMPSPPAEEALRNPVNTMADLGRQFAKWYAPNISSLIGGEPRPPIENLPQYGKVPQVTTDPRYTQSLPGVANVLQNFIAPPQAKAVPAIAAPLAARLAPDILGGAARTVAHGAEAVAERSPLWMHEFVPVEHVPP